MTYTIIMARIYTKHNFLCYQNKKKNGSCIFATGQLFPHYTNNTFAITLYSLRKLAHANIWKYFGLYNLKKIKENF